LKESRRHRAEHPKAWIAKIRAARRQMHADAGPPRAIRILDPARPAGVLRRATRAGVTAMADRPATNRAEAAITAEADLAVALAAPVQAAVAAMATAAGMEAARAGAATVEGMVVATVAAENADIIGMIPIPPMCRTMQLIS